MPLRGATCHFGAAAPGRERGSELKMPGIFPAVWVWGEGGETGGLAAVVVAGGEVGEEGVEEEEAPEGEVGGCLLGEGGAVVVDAEEAFDAPGGGHEAAEGVPEGAHGEAGPGEA